MKVSEKALCTEQPTTGIVIPAVTQTDIKVFFVGTVEILCILNIVQVRKGLSENWMCMCINTIICMLYYCLLSFYNWLVSRQEFGTLVYQV